MSSDPGCKGPLLDIFYSSPNYSQSPCKIPTQQPLRNING